MQTPHIIFVTISIICLFNLNHVKAGFADWFNWQSSDTIQEPTSAPNRPPREEVDLPNVPFENLPNDERFLQEAQYFGLTITSQLDSCQQQVVLRLRASCASLTEEQLSKLSVALLNCQSAAEGRQQFPCTDDMTLRECTGNMDPDTWNTYHLMSNRARAVCLSSRQAQFRVLTEMTVNKLMASARGQLDAMDHLKDGQERLSSLTEGTLKSVSEGHHSLLRQQESIKTAQRNAHNFMAHSLRDLTREKSLAAAGHRELARIAHIIKQKLDAAEEELGLQDSTRKKQHEELLSDLKKIQAQSLNIWNDIDKSTNEILSRHEIALGNYEQTLENLKAINESIQYLQSILLSTQKEVDQRLGWIADTLGGTGGQLDLVIACLSQFGFLLFAMLTTVFLELPHCSRVLLFSLVSLNMVQLLLRGPEAAFSIPATTLVIVVGTLVHQVVRILHRWLAAPPGTTPIAPGPSTTSSSARTTPNGAATAGNKKPSVLNRIVNSASSVWGQAKQYLQSDRGPSTPRAAGFSPVRGGSSEEHSESSDQESDSGLEELPRRPPPFGLRGLDLQTPRDSSPFTRRSRSGSRPLTPRQQCGAMCVSGQPCRLAAGPGGLCHRHTRSDSNATR